MTRKFAVGSTLALAAIAAAAIIMMNQALRPAELPTVNAAPPLEILTLRVRTPPVPPPPPPPPLKRKDVRDPDWASLLTQVHELNVRAGH